MGHDGINASPSPMRECGKCGGKKRQEKKRPSGLLQIGMKLRPSPVLEIATGSLFCMTHFLSPGLFIEQRFFAVLARLQSEFRESSFLKAWVPCVPLYHFTVVMPIGHTQRCFDRRRTAQLAWTRCGWDRHVHNKSVKFISTRVVSCLWPRRCRLQVNCVKGSVNDSQKSII